MRAVERQTQAITDDHERALRAYCSTPQVNTAPEYIGLVVRALGRLSKKQLYGRRPSARGGEILPVLTIFGHLLASKVRCVVYDSNAAITPIIILLKMGDAAGA